MTDDFDLVVLGGGPGGYAAALYGASAGCNIAMVEERRVGGTCLHRGCIPAKELLQTAEVLRTVRDAAEFGVQTTAPTLDLAHVADAQARRSSTVSPRASRSLLKGRKVTVVPGTGTLAPDARTIRVSDGSRTAGPQRAARHRVGAPVASDPRPRIRRRPVLSSDHVLEIDEVPRASRGDRRRRDRVRVRVVPHRRGRRGHDARSAAADPHRRRPAGRANGRRARSRSAASRCRPACRSAVSTAPP